MKNLHKVAQDPNTNPSGSYKWCLVKQAHENWMLYCQSTETKMEQQCILLYKMEYDGPCAGIVHVLLSALTVQIEALFVGRCKSSICMHVYMLFISLSAGAVAIHKNSSLREVKHFHNLRGTENQRPSLLKVKCPTCGIVLLRARHNYITSMMAKVCFSWPQWPLLHLFFLMAGTLRGGRAISCIIYIMRRKPVKRYILVWFIPKLQLQQQMC